MLNIQIIQINRRLPRWIVKRLALYPRALGSTPGASRPLLRELLPRQILVEGRALRLESTVLQLLLLLRLPHDLNLRFPPKVPLNVALVRVQVGCLDLLADVVFRLLAASFHLSFAFHLL